MADRVMQSMERMLHTMVCFFALQALSCNAETVSEQADFDEDAVVEPSKEELKAPLEQTEIKVTFTNTDMLMAIALFKLEEKKASKRDIYFFDTPKQYLYSKGVILRARKIENAADDSTIKIRPLDANLVSLSWFALDGFKCETDQTGTTSVMSCSLTTRQDQGEIGDVAEHFRPIEKLFSGEQETFLSLYGAKIFWSSLVTLGRIDALVWKYTTKKFSYPMTFERWRLPNGDWILEASIRVSSAQAKVASSRLDAFLSSKGFAISDKQDTKTRQAFVYFSSVW